MKKLRSIFFPILCMSIFLFLSACKDDDEQAINPCDEIICENGGICIDGMCDCPDGYSGADCSIVYVPVAQRLLTETPFEIVNSGMPLDSLYGQMYAGGLIFYLDFDNRLVNQDGLVAAENTFTFYRYGCNGENTGVPDVVNSPLPIDTVLGARIGDGWSNTQELVNAACGTQSAATLCDEYDHGIYDDWFLPSRGELYELLINIGNVEQFSFYGTYLSSTEIDSVSIWAYQYQTPGAAPKILTKQVAETVQAVRAF